MHPEVEPLEDALLRVPFGDPPGASYPEAQLFIGHDGPHEITRDASLPVEHLGAACGWIIAGESSFMRAHPNGPVLILGKRTHHAEGFAQGIAGIQGDPLEVVGGPAVAAEPSSIVAADPDIPFAIRKQAEQSVYG